MEHQASQPTGGSAGLSAGKGLTASIRSSLQAKLERLLATPIIAAVPNTGSTTNDAGHIGGPGILRALQMATRDSQPTAGRSGQGGAWTENPDDGTCTVQIHIDFDDLWRGQEKEILETFKSTVESPVTFLTSEQKTLLERSPREFLALNPRPESAELVAYRSEDIGGSERVVELTLAAPPASPTRVRYIAIVPNLVQIERQLDALEAVVQAGDDGPLAPLRALVGLCDAPRLKPLAAASTVPVLEPSPSADPFDEFQTECITKAMSTPHFAVIQGPPGSGKTTVITSIIRRALVRGDRVLVVSPTHVAVDNVVEKLAPCEDRLSEDRLDPHTMPVRYAARKSKLSKRALEYWVGNQKQMRGATLSRRAQRRLTDIIQIAGALYAREDPNASGNAPLSSAVAAVESVICGTPIGILSYAPVKGAEPGQFDLLIVDEVSKMTLPEFLAIAVKAKRWVLVGDPQQLPPYNNSEENGPTLDDVLHPLLELVCSVGAVLERARPNERRAERLVVVSSDPARAATAIRAHINAVRLKNTPSLAVFGAEADEGVLICSPQEVDDACAATSPARGRDRTDNPNHCGALPILVERGIRLSRPEFASGTRFVEPRDRAQALVFETAFNVYHAQPWSARSDQKLRLVGFRNGLEKYLPSAAAMEALSGSVGPGSGAPCHAGILSEIAARFAINTISVYDWLTGIPTEFFDVSPLQELQSLSPKGLCNAVRPFVGVLEKQYRMHASLSRVPRDLFYFGKALHDGKSDGTQDCRVILTQVNRESDAAGETNTKESERICRALKRVNDDGAVQGHKLRIMVITPYSKQKALLAEAIDELRQRGAIDNLDVDAFTLDSCQGREAAYVIISLVRSYATPFLDMPKRWNVALTRAMKRLVVVGDVEAYLQEAARARRDARCRPAGNRHGGTGRARPLMSLLARILEAYDHQIAEHRKTETRT